MIRTGTAPDPTFQLLLPAYIGLQRPVAESDRRLRTAHIGASSHASRRGADREAPKVTTTPVERPSHACAETVGSEHVAVLAVPARAIVRPRRVYRGDSRHPELIFESGFRIPSEYTNTDIKEYGLHNTPSPWIGCSVRASLAASFPERARGCTWVYEIDSPGAGIDVNRVLGLGYVFRAEREVIFLRDLPTERIVRAVWWSWATPTKRVVMNPQYEPAGG